MKKTNDNPSLFPIPKLRRRRRQQGRRRCLLITTTTTSCCEGGGTTGGYGGIFLIGIGGKIGFEAGEGGDTVVVVVVVVVAEGFFLLVVVDVVSVGEEALLDCVVGEEGYDVGVEAGLEHACSELGVGLYVIGGSTGSRLFGSISVVGGVGSIVFLRGGNTESTGTSPFKLNQPFLFTECRLEWIFRKTIEGGWCKS